MPESRGLSKGTPLDADGKSFQMPIISFVDTPGAFPGNRSGRVAQLAEAIAVNLREMATFEVPIIVCVIGEGGSGGALGVAVADYVIALETPTTQSFHQKDVRRFSGKTALLLRMLQR